MSQDIVKSGAGELADIVYHPQQVMDRAAEAAAVLKSVIDRKPKPVVINGETYLEYEDWQTVARFYGLSTRTLDATPMDIAGVAGAKARAEVINRDGVVVGGAEAYCLRDEERWSTRPVYEWQGEGDDRKRVKVRDESVPWFQLASMAQTRAASKALSNVLRWVVVLAGYRGTPAEEMTGSEPRTERAPGGPHWCETHKTHWFKKGKMRGYAHPIEGTDEWCNEPEAQKTPPAAPVAEHPTKEATGQPLPPAGAVPATPEGSQTVHPDGIITLRGELMQKFGWKDTNTAEKYIVQQAQHGPPFTEEDLTKVRKAAKIEANSAPGTR